MAITATEKTKGYDSGSKTAYTTASITPTANTCTLIAIAHRMGTGTAAVDATSVAGAGLTWAKIDTQAYNADGHYKVDLWYGVGASPSAGALTITWASQTQSNCQWCVIECDGVDPTSPIVQSAKTSSTSASSLTVTLSAFSNSANATVGAFAARYYTLTAGSGYALTSSTKNDQQAVGLEFVDANDTSVDISSSGTAEMAGIAVELKASGGGGSFFQMF